MRLVKRVFDKLRASSAEERIVAHLCSVNLFRGISARTEGARHERNVAFISAVANLNQVFGTLDTASRAKHALIVHSGHAPGKATALLPHRSAVHATTLLLLLLPLAQEAIGRKDRCARAEVIIRDVVHVHWVWHALIATLECERARSTLALLGIRLHHEIRQ